jgi:hypothetical protein
MPMKILVNLIQLAIITAIILPVLYIWETDKVDKFCKKIEPGITQEKYLDLVEQHNVKLTEVVGDGILGGHWHATVKTHLPLLQYHCQTKGVSKLVVTADIVKSLVSETDVLDVN